MGYKRDMRALAIALAVNLISCWANRVADAEETKAPIAADDARLVLSRNCGPCHQGDSPNRNPAAIAVFDTADKSWVAKLSDTRLRKAKGRFGLTAPRADKKMFACFVEEEMTRRSAGVAK
jgi:hypothetical protein